MIEIRTLKTQEELKQAIKLCNEVFFQCDSFFERRYPHVFNAENLNHLFAAFEDQTIISFIATYPSVLRYKDQVLHACALGAVCTHPNYRGQGLSSKLLVFVEETLKNVTDFLYISGEGKNYLRFGAQTVGLLNEIHLSKEILHSNDLLYTVHDSINSLNVDAYLYAYMLKKGPKFDRSYSELSLMLKGHFEKLKDDQNFVLESQDHASFVCLRVGYEENIKIAYMIESVGNESLCLKMAENQAFKMNVDKLFYRSSQTIQESHLSYAHPIHMTGSFKVIRPSLKLDSLALFGDLTQKGIYPSFRVDDLNFL